ncbi:MAG: hypothetical protein HWD59_00075 [Coxiellaceae bacterium]|nr:MAG: hypothetical protein HWD59_00075 [Coxiellaceae bacterium]
MQKNIDSFFKIEEFENDINEQPFSKKKPKNPRKMVAIETNQAKNNNFDTSNLIFNEKTQENQKDINPTPKLK